MTGAGSNPTVLVVDDDSAIRSTESNVLKHFGLSAKEAEDGHQALRMMADEPFEIVLLDIKMPGKDGFEVCNVLKQDKQTTKIPLVFLTSYEDEETARKAVNLGANGYLVKPFNHESLLYTVESFIRYRR